MPRAIELPLKCVDAGTDYSQIARMDSRRSPFVRVRIGADAVSDKLNAVYLDVSAH